MKRGPRKTGFAGKMSTFHRRKVDRKAAGGHYTKGEMPPGTPRSPVYKILSPAPQPRVRRGALLFLRGKLSSPSPVLRPKEEGLREEPVPPVRSRAARTAVPQWRFRRNARDRKGELANPKGLTEGL